MKEFGWTTDTLNMIYNNEDDVLQSEETMRYGWKRGTGAAVSGTPWYAVNGVIQPAATNPASAADWAHAVTALIDA